MAAVARGPHSLVRQAVTVAKDAAKEAKVSTTAYGVMFCGCFMCKVKEKVRP